MSDNGRDCQTYKGQKIRKVIKQIGNDYKEKSGLGLKDMTVDVGNKRKEARK